MRKILLRTTLLLGLHPLLTTTGRANDLQLSNASYTAINTVDGHLNLRFDISWQNSWRVTSAPGNWDAAWVFVKFRHAGTGLWQHARLHGDAGHIAPLGSTITTGLLVPGTPFDTATNWGTGAFIHRSADGTGAFAVNGVELRWDFGQNGIIFADIAEVRIFALEMVYQSQAAFFVGSGGTESASLTNGAWVSGATIPLQVTSENAITIAQTPGALWGTSGSGNGAIGGAGSLPAAYPKGFAPTYLMKYEIAQQDYAAFLNTLPRAQQNARTGTDLAAGVTSVTNRYVMSTTATLTNRNGIRCDATVSGTDAITFYCDLSGNDIGDEATDGKGLGCNYLNWGDLTAYLDWSGLRPMTELEFEKACRGPNAPVTNEYPWGTTTAMLATSLLNAGNDAESPLPTFANANAWNATTTTFSGPMRVGAFATSTSTRAQAGAGYYGGLELGGNSWERIVTVGNAVGRAYTGLHGDGTLDGSGTHNVTNWPSPATAAGGRGGPSPPSPTHLRTSDRVFATSFGNTRNSNFGGRGIRTAP